MIGEQDGMEHEITDGQVGDWLERASHRTATTGMVAEGVRIVDRLIKENGHLRHKLKAYVEANAMYEETIERLNTKVRNRLKGDE